MERQYVQSFEDFLNESQWTGSVYKIEHEDGLNVPELFYKYDKMYPNEYNEDNWIKYHYGAERQGGEKALIESLRLIGDGEITKESQSHMYKEMLKNDKLILVVHGSLKSPPYGGMDGYHYSLGVYWNNPRTYGYGGGYGSPGIVGVSHPSLITYDDYDKVHHNRNIISKVCADIKEYVLINH